MADYGSSHVRGAGFYNSPAARSNRAEREAKKRIQESQKNVERFAKEAEAQIDYIKESYRREQNNVREKGQNSLDRLHNDGAEKYQKSKLAQQSALRKSRKEGERTIDKLNTYYRDQNRYLSDKFNRELGAVKKSFGRQVEYERQTLDNQLNSLQKEHEVQVKITRKENEDQFTKIQEASKGEVETLKANHQVSIQRARKNFDNRYASLRESQADAINKIYNRVNNQINKIQYSTQKKLDAYSSRQNDEFYQGIQSGASLREGPDEFILTADIPVHEQKNVSVVVRGNQIVLQGSRENHERLEVTPGRFRSTNSFQTYRESFPVDWPINKNAVIKEFVGDRLIVTLPKTTSDRAMIHGRRPASEKGTGTAREPKFPDNLPVTSEDLVDPNEKDQSDGTVIPEYKK